MKTIYAAIIAATALIVLPTVSEAQTTAQQVEEQGRIVRENLTVNPSPLVLEYKLGTHVEAVARKYGQLDKVVKGCDYPEYWNFEESALVDLIGDNLTESTIGIARRSYVEGQKFKTPPCGQSTAFVGLLVEQVERHRKIILETSEKITQAEKRD
jgi:hypothetical protein